MKAWRRELVHDRRHGGVPGRGYAAGATAVVSQAALDAGVCDVVFYTDLANPVSNARYERLGYRAVEDRVVLPFEPPVTLHP
ncbi:MAG TPA: hypothetical protein VFQ68_42265 [Streptosporangiaceae bacterium]|nr:hypothetical protein [Streptosporangiaceae bacterium]